MPTVSDQWIGRYRCVTSHYVLGHSPRPMSVVKQRRAQHFPFEYQSDQTCDSTVSSRCGYFSVCFDWTINIGHINISWKFANTGFLTDIGFVEIERRASVGNIPTDLRNILDSTGTRFPLFRRKSNSAVNGFTPFTLKSFLISSFLLISSKTLKSRLKRLLKTILFQTN